MSRGGTPLAVVLLLATTSAAAHAGRLDPLGFDFSSESWSVVDQTKVEEVELRSAFGNRGNLVVQSVNAKTSCDSVIAATRGATGQPFSGVLAKERGFVDGLAVFACRERRGRMIAVMGNFVEDSPREPQERAFVALLDDADRALAVQQSLRLIELGWELGPYFQRWQPGLSSDTDMLTLVGPGEVLTAVYVSRRRGSCAESVSDEVTVARPSFVPATYAARVMVRVDPDDTTTIACLDHGSGRYDVHVSHALAGKKKADAKTQKSVTEILVAIAKAAKASPPIPDAVTAASDEVSEARPTPTPTPAPTPTPTPEPTPEPTPTPAPEADNSPEAVARRLAMLEQMEAQSAAASSSSSDSSSYASIGDTGSTRGWWPESPTVVLQLRRLGVGETMTTAARDAIGGTLTLAKPLYIEEVGGVEYSGTIGYDELAGVSYDVRAGGGLRFGDSLTTVLGVGLDAWNGVDGGVELSAEPYLYVGARIPIGPLSVRGEYLPRNGGADEKRVRVGLIRLRDAGRKIVAEGNAQFFDGATVLTFGVGVGI